MSDWLATTLKLAAAGSFGLAVALLALVAHRLTHGKDSAGAKRAEITSMRRTDMRQAALRESEFYQLVLPIISSLAGTVNRLGLGPLREYLHEPYVKAGYPGGLDDDEVVAVGFLTGLVISALLAFLAGALIGITWVWIGLIGMPMGFVGVSAHLKAQANEREVQILRAMPYLLDLLVLMLRSGTSLRIAMGRVVDDFENHAVGVELGQVLAEIDVGSPRAEAFKKMDSRLKIPDVTALVEAIVQSEELGWPLADTLERLADRLNSERVLAAQTKAGAAGVYVMLPSTLVLASAVLLLFSPFIVRFLRTGTLVE